MKYTILGFSQAKLIELKLDIDDALILRYFIDFKDSGNMSKEIFDNDMFYWVSYDFLKKDLPILDISKDMVYRKFKKLVNSGILKHKTKRVGGTFSFYALSEKYSQLISSIETTEGMEKITDGAGKIPEGYGKNSRTDTEKIPEGYGKNSRTKDPSTKDPSTKEDPSTKDPCTDEKEVDKISWKSILLAWNDLPSPIKPVRSITDIRKDKIKARINSLKLKPDDIVQAINGIKDSDYLQGKKNGWIIDFDWLFKDDTKFIKVFEGFYANKVNSDLKKGESSNGRYTGNSKQNEYTDGPSEESIRLNKIAREKGLINPEKLGEDIKCDY